MEKNSPTRQSRAHRLQRTTLTLGVASLLLLIGTTACQAASAQSSFDPTAGRFAPCPDSPNCVSTQAAADDSDHAIAPLPYTGSVAEAREKLLGIINTLPRTTLVTDEPVAGGHYIHVEFRSFVFRFVDDVEFFIKENEQVIEFRSAARLGHSDMGVNRRRMENIRTQFHAGT